MGGLHKYEKERIEARKRNGVREDLGVNPTFAEKIAYYDGVIAKNEALLKNPGLSSAKTLNKAKEIIENAIHAKDKLIEDSKSKGF